MTEAVFCFVSPLFALIRVVCERSCWGSDTEGKAAKDSGERGGSRESFKSAVLRNWVVRTAAIYKIFHAPWWVPNWISALAYRNTFLLARKRRTDVTTWESKIMKTQTTSLTSNAEQSNLANNDSESEGSQIIRQMTMFAQRVCSMLGGIFFVAAFVLTLAAIPSRASAFTFTTIDVPGATGTGASRSNAAGQIVGGYADATGAGHGFLLDKGDFTTIDVPDATGTAAFGINAAGQIVGVYGDASGTEHGFLLDKGTFTTIDPPGSILSQAFDINARGQIVGDYTDASGTSHGFLLDKGTFTTIDPPGSVFTQAIGINAGGRIVGDFELPGQHHGFLLDKGTFTLIDFPGPSTGTDALGINAAGQVVGRYVAGGTEHGFLLDKGTFTTVDPPGSTFTEAIGINASGQIVGDYTDASGTGHGFVATP